MVFSATEEKAAKTPVTSYTQEEILSIMEKTTLTKLSRKKNRGKKNHLICWQTKIGPRAGCQIIHSESQVL